MRKAEELASPTSRNDGSTRVSRYETYETQASLPAIEDKNTDVNKSLALETLKPKRNPAGVDMSRQERHKQMMEKRKKMGSPVSNSFDKNMLYPSPKTNRSKNVPPLANKVRDN